MEQDKSNTGATPKKKAPAKKVAPKKKVEAPSTGELPIVPTIEKYAIFQSGGKQYQAIPGKTVAVEKIEGNVGDTVEISEVLFRKNGKDSFEFGTPYVADAALKMSIVKQTKGPKVIVFRRKRRKKYRVKKGHRQPLTVLRTESI